jgi:hypothetical protein
MLRDPGHGDQGWGKNVQIQGKCGRSQRSDRTVRR